MGEALGEAVLRLRTDDSGLDAGMAKAKAGADSVGSSFDKTKVSADQLSEGLRRSGRTAEESGTRFRKAANDVTTSAGAQRAGLQNLTRQIGDISTMYSLGMRPQQIFASQIGQVTDAAQMALGGTSKLARFLGGPWGIAIMIGVQMLGPLVGKLFETQTAMHEVELAADSMGQAQSALGGIFDLTTGKIRNQNEMLRLNARLLAYNLQEQAAAKRLSAHDVFVGAQERSFGDIAFGSQSAEIGGFNTTAGARNSAAAQQLLIDIGQGRISREQAMKRAERMDFSGTKVTREEFLGAIRDSAYANAADKLASGINKSLDSNALDPMFRQPGSSRKERTKKETGPSAEDIAARHEQAMERIHQEQLQAELQLTTNAQDRADIERELLIDEFKQRVAQVQNDKDFTDAQKKAQIQALEALYGQSADGSITVAPNSPLEARIRREERQRLEQEAQALADQQYQAQKDSLQLQLDLADTEGERKKIALQILDAEDAYLRAKLEAVIASQAATDAEKKNAQVALDALNATAGLRRQGVERANETTVERYLRDLNKTPDQINEAIDKIKIDGLQELNSDLTDAILRTKSLGEAFHAVAMTIVRDLVQIGVEQMVVRPLANLLFGGTGTEQRGGGGLLGGLFGSILHVIGLGGGLAPGVSASSVARLAPGVSSTMDSFAGLFAKGGRINAGEWGIVGDAGPEVFVPDSSGTIFPNSDLRRSGSGANDNVIRVILEDTTGLFKARVEEYSAPLAMSAAQQQVGSALDRAVGPAVQDYLRRRG